MTPREYIEAVVRPNLADLERDEGDLRHALNALHAVDALAARIFVAAGGKAATGAKDDTDYREDLVEADASGNFRILRDVAKAVKHAELVRGNPIITSASQVDAKPTGSQAGLMMAGDGYGLGEFGGPPMVLVPVDGVPFSVGYLIGKALAFLEEEMARRGL